jgi:hypothetical protein
MKDDELDNLIRWAKCVVADLEQAKKHKCADAATNPATLMAMVGSLSSAASGLAHVQARIASMVTTYSNTPGDYGL